MLPRLLLCYMLPPLPPPSLRDMAIRASHSRSRGQFRGLRRLKQFLQGTHPPPSSVRPRRLISFLLTFHERQMTLTYVDGRGGCFLSAHSADPYRCITEKVPIPFGKQPPPIHWMVIYMFPHPSVSPPLLFSFHPLTYCPFVYWVPKAHAIWCDTDVTYLHLHHPA